MTRLLRFGPVFSACLALGACAQLIGLDKFDDNGGTAGVGKGGSAGKSGSGGVAGQAQASGGHPGTGGSIVSRGGSGGSGGTNAGAAGESGASTSGGSGGRGGAGGSNTGGLAGMEEAGASGAGTGGSGGNGGTTGPGNGGAGAGGESTGGCSQTIEIVTHGSAELDDESSASIPYYDYQWNVDPQIGSPASDYLWVDFYQNSEYDGDATGIFHLGHGDEANYATCSRCVYLGQDVANDGNSQAYFFAKSGTMTIASDSQQMVGMPDVQLTDVLLSEITIDPSTNVSTEVPGGRCLHLTSASLVSTTPVAPPSWTCPTSAYGDAYCDCGCGAPDIDCASSLVGACEFCGGSFDPGSCVTTADDCSEIDLNDNSKCATNQGWTCDALSYGDGQSCDCGCGIVDVDCASADSSLCDACDDPSSCTAVLNSSCTDIDAVDNSKCD